MINTESAFAGMLAGGLGTQNITVLGIQASGFKLTSTGKLVAIR